MTPTQRSLAVLRELGYTAAITEKWNPHAKIRQDLFGCIDILAIGHGEIIAVQATSGSNHAKRQAKSESLPALLQWLGSGGVYEVWSFAKRGPRGKRKLWTLRRASAVLTGPHPGVIVWRDVSNLDAENGDQDGTQQS